MSSRHLRPVAVAMAMLTTISITACSPAASVESGARVQPAETATAAPYAPVDRTALAFGLPDLVGALRLMPSSAEVRAGDEAAFAHDLAIKPKLVARGLGPSVVSIEQKGDGHDGELPTVATSAVWVDGMPATEFAEFDPSFYLLLTSVTPDQYRWQGEKPMREHATILGRDVYSSDWGRFQVVWYPLGEVLYVVMAENQQLLEMTLRQMPWPAEVAA